MAREIYREIYVDVENVDKDDEVVELKVVMKYWGDSGWELFDFGPAHDPDDRVPSWVFEEVILDTIENHGGIDSYKNHFEIVRP